MKKYNLLCCGPFGQEFSEYVNTHYPESISSRFTNKVSQSDLEGMNALAGFYQFDHLDLSSITWIHAFAAGIDVYLKPPTLPSDVTITRTLGFMDQRIGEYCLAYILADLKSIIPVKDAAGQQEWDRINLEVLYNKRVLIYGTGFVGQGTAKCLSNLAESITGMSVSGKVLPPFSEVIASKDNIDLSGFDVIINTLPLTASTHDYFNLDEFKRYHDALFINVGRGQSLVEEDLIRAIEAGHVRKANLDVFQQEPLPKDHPFWSHPAIVVTPHHSGLTTFDDIRKSFDEVISLLKKGKTNRLFVDLNKGY